MVIAETRDDYNDGEHETAFLMSPVMCEAFCVASLASGSGSGRGCLAVEGVRELFRAWVPGGGGGRQGVGSGRGCLVVEGVREWVRVWVPDEGGREFRSGCEGC